MSCPCLELLRTPLGVLYVGLVLTVPAISSEAGSTILAPSNSAPIPDALFLPLGAHLTPPIPPNISREQTYTQQWNSWREAGGTGEFRPPELVSPAHVGHAHPLTPSVSAMPLAIPASRSRDGGGHFVGDPMDDSESSVPGEDRRHRRRRRSSTTKQTSREVEMELATSAEAGTKGGTPRVSRKTASRAPATPALLSALSSPRSGAASEADCIGREGSWGPAEDGDLAAAMRGAGRGD